MKGVTSTRPPRACQGGVTWNEYNRATGAYGLATTGGVVSTTGMAGLTLGGGLGWLMGKYGMAVDNVRRVELVEADGRCAPPTTSRIPTCSGRFAAVAAISAWPRPSSSSRTRLDRSTAA